MKYLKYIICISLLICLFACDKNIDSQINNETNIDEQNVLVVYFSATGNTKRIAEYIAEYTNGDIFELVPEEPYSNDDLNYNNPNSRVSNEHNSPDLQNVKLKTVSPDNFDEYDIIFIGHPIWWGIAAWPVNSFIIENDFTNKTIIPFCTSVSSPLSDSAELLKNMNSSGDWLSGIRFSSYTSQSEIEDWLSDLF